MSYSGENGRHEIIEGRNDGRLIVVSMAEVSLS